MAVLKIVRQEIVKFCSTTSIQGMRNVTDSEQGCFIQLLWIIVVVISFILSGICIKESIDGISFRFLDMTYIL